MEVPQVLTEMLGMEPCTFTAWTIVPYASLLILFSSLCFRMRGITFATYYQKPGRSPPRYYTHFSAIPYESIIAFVISLPRAYSTFYVSPSQLTFSHLKEEILSSQSFLHWWLVVYIVVLDIYERRQWNKKTLTLYYEMKARDQNPILSKEQAEDSRNAVPENADVEANTENDAEPVKRNLYRRIIAALAPKKHTLSALNIAASYQIISFSKMFCATVFLLNTSTFSCIAERSEEGDLSVALPWAIICIVASYRGLQLMVEGYRFTKREL